MMEICRNHKEEALVALCGLCGLRVSEAISLEVTDVNVQDLTLLIRGKGDKERTVPISSRAWTHMNMALVDAFSTEDHRLCPWENRAARAVVTRLGRKASLTRSIASHDLRATFATEALSRTNDLRAVQEVLGHENVTTTQIYTLIEMQKMRNVVEW
jgi:integrase/recombinase XerD